MSHQVFSASSHIHSSLVSLTVITAINYHCFLFLPWTGITVSFMKRKPVQYLSAALRKPMPRAECFVIAALKPSIPFFACVYCVLVYERGGDTCAHMYVHFHAKVRGHEVSFSVVLHLSLFFLSFSHVFIWCVTCM